VGIETGVWVMKEQEFKNWFRDNWNGWVAAYEPRRGGTVGVADLQILIRGRLLPVELKVGEVQGKHLISHDVRASQVQWHRELFKAGGYSVFLVGVGEGKKPDQVFVFPGAKGVMLQSKLEWRASDIIDVINFSSDLHDKQAFLMGCYS